MRHYSQPAEPCVHPVKPDANRPTCFGFNGRFPTDQAPPLQGIAPEYTASAGAIIGPDKWLYAEQKGLLVPEPGKAREIGRQAMAF